MKKFISLIIVIILIFIISCNNDNKTTIESSELNITITHTLFNQGTKNTKSDTVPICIDESLDYIKYKINNDYHYANIFTDVSGNLHSKVIKTDPGHNTISEFYIYHDNNPIGTYGNEDDLIMASPLPGSDYYSLMEYPLNIEFDVEPFRKVSVNVDVLCFDTTFYHKFGFYWFDINTYVVRNQCWFGDLCTGKLNDYNGSLYEQQTNGIQFDMPAIFKVDVYHDDILSNSYSNENWLGEGDCLNVQWVDNLSTEDTIKFVLYIYLPIGDTFGYVYYDSYVFTDNNPPDPSNDGVFDFVIGTCQVDNADAIYEPYLNLPSTVNMKIGNHYNPGDQGGYVDLILTGFNNIYDIHPNDTLAAYCTNQNETIQVNHLYNDIQVISPYDLSNLPISFNLTLDQIKKLIYLGNLINNQNNVVVQHVIWHITNNYTLNGTDEINMFNDVSNNYQSFGVLPGGYEPVFFYKDGVQPFVIFVDP
jgi:hypothetical protein